MKPIGSDPRNRDGIPYRGVLFALAVLALVAATLVAAGRSGQMLPLVAKAAPSEGASRSAIERGRYLVAIGGCNDCHTPYKMGPNGPEPDMSRALSGHPAELAVPTPKLEAPWIWAGVATNTAFAGPWGITYAPNLTPDLETGFGVYTEEMFIQAMRTGKHMGAGRPIMPPMPWQGVGQMTDEDLKSVFAYLQDIPAIKNQAPSYQSPQAR